MSNEVKGVRKVSDEELRKHPCDQSKPFVFLSYAHKDCDLVRSIFMELCNAGYNVWLDALNIRHDNSSWNKYARDAILNPNCHWLLFFRGENSVISKPCSNELSTAIHRKTGSLPPISVDIWKKQTTMGLFFAEMQGDADVSIEEVNLCSDFAEMTDKEANAFRLREDCDNDISILCSKIVDMLKYEGKASIPTTSPVEETKHSFKYDWSENTSTLYDYFFGAYDVTYQDDIEEPEEFGGYSPSLAIKKYHTERGEEFVVFINDIGNDDGEGGGNNNGYPEDEPITVAFACNDGSTAEDFIREFEEKADENGIYYCGYLLYYIRNVAEINFTTCAIKREGENVELLENNGKIFLKLMLSDEDKHSIETLTNKISRYTIATDSNNCYNYWDH